MLTDEGPKRKRNAALEDGARHPAAVAAPGARLDWLYLALLTTTDEFPPTTLSERGRSHLARGVEA